MALRPPWACMQQQPRSLNCRYRSPGANYMSATEEMAKPRWRRWLKRIGLGLLALIALLAIFHRPLFFEGTRYLIVRAAQQQHLDLTYK